MQTMMAKAQGLRPQIAIAALEPWQRPLSIGLRIGDVLAVAGTGIVTLHIRTIDGAILVPQFLALTLGVLFAAQCLALAGCYDVKSIDQLTTQLSKALFGWAAAFGCMLAVLYMIKMIEPVSRLWSISWFVTALAALIALRCIGKYWIVQARESGAFLRNVAIVREPQVPIDRILDGIGADPSLLPLADIVVDLDTADQVEDVIRQVRALDGAEQLLLVCSTHNSRALNRIVKGLRHLPLEINLVSSPIDGEVPLISLRAVGSLPATVLLERPQAGPLSLQKEIFDRVVAFCLLVFVAPLLAVIAIAVKLDSRGPVLYRQGRLGFNREQFEVLKFRTMRTEHCDAPGATSVRQATRDDDRVTRVGRFLRRSSLDELPQLFNVLRGDMSLVGPRPHAVAHDRHYAELIDGYLGRHRVKPGITGWAQVNGYRGETRTLEDMRRRIELDLQYIDNWSLGLDLKILLRTPMAGFVHENAY